MPACPIANALTAFSLKMASQTTECGADAMQMLLNQTDTLFIRMFLDNDKTARMAAYYHCEVTYRDKKTTQGP